MDGLLGTSPAVFIGLTVVLVGGCTILAGRAMAANWRGPWQVVGAAFGLTLADRFLVYALFDGELLSPTGFLIDFVVLTVLGLVSYRITRVERMVRQYPWKYRKRSPFAYVEIEPS
ncbi:MAG TPA: hypothetical protein ENJ38_02340 [Rhodospirillales bacterium]|nr:hypothetical protein [Rhodospirillales bacterium]